MEDYIMKGGSIMTDILTAEDTINFINNNTLKEGKAKKRRLYSMFELLEIKYNKKYDKLIEENIEKNSKIKDGRAVIKGTRITTEDVIYITKEAQVNHEQNWLEYIFREYPSIQNKEQILSAMLYLIKYEIKTSEIIKGTLT